MRLGVIADTHGLLRPQVFDAFAEVDHILHAGDLGSLELLTELEALAPVTAVYGNTDGGAPDFALILLNTRGVDVNDFLFANSAAQSFQAAGAANFYHSDYYLA